MSRFDMSTDSMDSPLPREVRMTFLYFEVWLPYTIKWTQFKQAGEGMFQMKSLVKMCVYQVHLHVYITFEDYTIFKNLAISLRTPP